MCSKADKRDSQHLRQRFYGMDILLGRQETYKTVKHFEIQNLPRKSTLFTLYTHRFFSLLQRQQKQLLFNIRLQAKKKSLPLLRAMARKKKESCTLLLQTTSQSTEVPVKGHTHTHIPEYTSTAS